MAVTEHQCPECESRFRLKDASAERKSIRCPRCDARVSLTSSRSQTEQERPRNRAPVQAQEQPRRRSEVQERPRSESSPRPRSAPRDDYDDEQPRRSKRSRQQEPTKGMSQKTIGILIGGGLFVVGVMVLAVVLTNGPDKKDDRVAGNPNRKVQPNPEDRQDPNGRNGKLQDNGRNNLNNVPPENGKDNPNHVPPPNRNRPQPPLPEITIPTQPIALPTGDGRPRLVLDPGGHSGGVKEVIFTPDSKRLITISQDKTIRIWSVVTGELESTIRLAIGAGADGSLYEGALNPNGRILAVSGQPLEKGKQGVFIYLIDLESEQVALAMRVPKGMPSALDWSKNGRILAVGNFNGTVSLYDPAKRGFQGVLPGKHNAPVQDVSYHPSGRYVVSSARDKTIRLWDLMAKPIRAKVITGLPEVVNTVQWSPDGNSFVSGGVDGVVRRWAPEGEPKDLFRKVVKNGAGTEGTTQIVTLSYSPDGRELLYSGIAWKGEVGIIDARAGKERIAPNHHNNTVLDSTFSPDGKLVASTGGNDIETVIWKVSTGEKVHTLQGRGRAVLGLGWHPNGKEIVWGNVNRIEGPFGNMPLERSFHLESLTFTRYNKRQPTKRAILRMGAHFIRPVDLFTIQIGGPGRAIQFKTPEERERIYSASFLTPDRIIIGGAYRLYLIDLKGKVLRVYKGHSGIHWAVAPHPSGKYFATGSTDQTICIWSPDQESPLMQLFFAGQNWIAWTPEGYYAASAYGERLMGWQINNGITKVATFHPAVQFRQSLYQPKLMKLLLRVGNLNQALVQAGVNQGNALSVQEVLPPTVAITTPTRQGHAQVAEGKFEVNAVAQSQGQHPVLAMRLLVDGRPYMGSRGVVVFKNPKQGQVGAKWTVDIPPGKHTLAVQAASKVSKGLSPVVRITKAGQKRQPDLYLLAYGISDYPGELKLNFAAYDAQTLHSTLRQTTRGVFRNMEAKLITDREATRQGIVEGLRWLEQKMTAHDVAIIFFSGHGAREANGNFYLVPVDARAEDIANSCVPGDRFKRVLEDLPGKVVLMLDCCHSGSVAEDRNVQRTADDLARDLVTDDYGIITMCSSLGSEYSMESTVTKGGFFTRGLIEGLKGRADLNRDQVVYVHELDFFTTHFVKKISSGMQNPTTGVPRHVKPFPLARR